MIGTWGHPTVLVTSETVKANGHCMELPSHPTALSRPVVRISSWRPGLGFNQNCFWASDLVSMVCRKVCVFGCGWIRVRLWNRCKIVAMIHAWEKTARVIGAYSKTEYEHEFIKCPPIVNKLQ